MNAKIKPNAIIIVLCLSFLSSILLFSNNVYGKGRDNILYSDRKNGYFIFAPPKGWVTEEYSDPRTKVAFHNPADREVYILIIVEEAPGDTFQTIKKRAEETCRMVRERGISCGLSSFSEIPQVVSKEFPNQFQDNSPSSFKTIPHIFY